MFNETSYSEAPPSNGMVAYQGGPVVMPLPDHQRRSRVPPPCCAKCARAQSGLSGCGCAPQEVIIIQEPESDAYGRSESGIPQWAIIAFLALGAVLIFKK